MSEKPIAALIEKIAKECEEANADKWTITKIVKKLSEGGETGIKDLRKQALEMLQILDPKAASVYASFQRMEVRTSSQAIEGFDRGNIIKSLLRETEVARGVAEKIGREVEEKIKDLEIESISTSLIREMVNVKLLEYGHENIRNQYTRLGLPVFEVDKRIARGPYNNKPMLTEYTLLRVLPHSLGKMHLSNEIFVGELQDFSTKPIAIALEAEIRETPRDSVFAILEKANRQSRLFSWRPNIMGLNAALAANTGKKTAKDAAMLFTKAAKAIFLGEKPIPAYNTMHLFEPESFSKKGLDRESMAGAANAILKSGTGQGRVFRNAIAIDTKYKLKLLKNMPERILNCRNSEWALANGLVFRGKGICTFTAMNLMEIALKNKDEGQFFEDLEKRAGALVEVDLLKRKSLLERDYLKREGVEVNELDSAVAIDDLVGASAIATESEKDSEISSFAEKIIASIKKSLPEKTIITELRNNVAIQKFSRHNARKFRQTETWENEGALQKNRNICRNYSFTAKAGSRKELLELVDNNARLIELNGWESWSRAT